MEKNNIFCWDSYKIYSDTNCINNQLKITEKEHLNNLKNFLLNEDYFDNKLNIQKEKYNIDLGASIINANNQIICFNKNTLINHSNSYFKVDKFEIENLNLEKTIRVKNIYSEFNGPRYRVTNVN
jgi:hypothetical protein